MHTLLLRYFLMHSDDETISVSADDRGDRMFFHLKKDISCDISLTRAVCSLSDAHGRTPGLRQYVLFQAHAFSQIQHRKCVNLPFFQCRL